MKKNVFIILFIILNLSCNQSHRPLSLEFNIKDIMITHCNKEMDGSDVWEGRYFIGIYAKSVNNTNDTLYYPPMKKMPANYGFSYITARLGNKNYKLIKRYTNGPIFPHEKIKLFVWTEILDTCITRKTLLDELHKIQLKYYYAKPSKYKLVRTITFNIISDSLKIEKLPDNTPFTE